jgi:hypothetical protein
MRCSSLLTSPVGDYFYSFARSHGWIRYIFNYSANICHCRYGTEVNHVTDRRTRAKDSTFCCSSTETREMIHHLKRKRFDLLL